MTNLVNDLQKRIKGEIRIDEPMKKHTSFRIGGPADIFVLPEGLEDVQEVVRFAREKKLPLFILGKGSNILVRDEGLRGIVLKTSPALNKLEFRGEEVTVGAAVSLPLLAVKALQKDLSGLEFIAGIPGTVGGAVVMNAGAAGHCLSEVVSRVRVMDFAGKISDLDSADLEFGYRQSKLQKENLLVLEAQFHLVKGNREEIKKSVDELIGKRKRSQPLSFPNAGSIFRNPPQEPAGKLIELIGAKGKRIGDAQISELHANFIINLGNAEAADVCQLMHEVQGMVKDRFNIHLEPEVKIVGG